MVASESPNLPAPATVVVTPEQSEHLARAGEWAKALAAPGRLAIVGILAARPGEAMPLAELAAAVGGSPATIERDLRQVIAAGLVQVDAWEPARPGRAPLPARMRFDGDYPRAMAGVIMTLHQLVRQARPEWETPRRDEREKTLAHFLPHGRLIGWPAQPKQLRHVLAAVADAFEIGRRYPEREVDGILKEIYPEDHCILRRALVDHRLLHRAAGVYWREAGTPAS
jgi:hypothetical protein